MKRNVRIIATMNQGDRMNLYLDCSGERVYLMPHRFNSKLFQLMKDGISINDLRRSQKMYKLQGDKTHTDRRRSRVLENSVNHIVNVVDEYIKYEYDVEPFAA